MDRNPLYLALHHYRHLNLPHGLDNRQNRDRRQLQSNLLPLLDSHRIHPDTDHYRRYHLHPYLGNHHHRNRLRMYSSIERLPGIGLRGLVPSHRQYQCLPEYRHNHRSRHRLYLDSLPQLDIHLDHPLLRHYQHRYLLFHLYSHLHHNQSWQ